METVATTVSASNSKVLILFQQLSPLSPLSPPLSLTLTLVHPPLHAPLYRFIVTVFN